MIFTADGPVHLYQKGGIGRPHASHSPIGQLSIRVRPRSFQADVIIIIFVFLTVAATVTTIARNNRFCFVIITIFFYYYYFILLLSVRSSSRFDFDKPWTKYSIAWCQSTNLTTTVYVYTRSQQYFLLSFVKYSSL